MDRLVLIIIVLGMLGMTAITRGCDFLARRQTLEAEALRCVPQSPDMAAPGPDLESGR